MKRFYRIFLISVLGFLVVAGFGGTAAALFNPFGGVNCSGSASSSAVCQNHKPETISGNNSILASTVSILALIAGIIAILIILVMSIQLIASNGDSTKINNARRGIGAALIGLVVVIAARTILVYVLNHL